MAGHKHSVCEDEQCRCVRGCGENEERAKGQRGTPMHLVHMLLPPAPSQTHACTHNTSNMRRNNTYTHCIDIHLCVFE